MTPRARARAVTAVVVAAAIGIAYPHLELAWKCRAAMTSSEACTWGRAYFPLARWAEPLIVAPIALAVIAVGAGVVGRLRKRSSTVH